MKRLPEIVVNSVPSGQRERLSRWLVEWEIEQALGEPIDTDIADDIAESDALPEGVATPTDKEDPPAVGQVRLLHPSLLPPDARPVHVAVLDVAAGDGKATVVPFGRFAEPATDGELLTERDAPCLHVLCLWNTRSFPLATIARSWLVDDLAKVELEDVRAVLRSTTGSGGPPIEFAERVGPPVQHPFDPRHIYLREERALVSAIGRDVVYPLSVGEDQDDLPMAAEPPPDDPYDPSDTDA